MDLLLKNMVVEGSTIQVIGVVDWATGVYPAYWEYCRMHDMFYDVRVEVGTSRSLFGQASRNGGKCSQRTVARRREHSRITRSDHASIIEAFL